MSIFKKKNETVTQSYRMITTDRNSFYSYDGKLYKSEIVRSCIRPEVTAVGKLVAKHIRETTGKNGEKKIDINPEVYIKFLLEEPNPYMTGQEMQEKLATQFILNGNAFALIVWDLAGLPCQLYPIPCEGVETVILNGELLFKFYLKDSKAMTVPYRDVIHIRRDYGDNFLFGTSPVNTLIPLMEVVNIMDQGLIKAIKNSGVIRWLLKFNQSLRKEDIKDRVQAFVQDYLAYESPTFGAAGVDSKVDADRIEPKDYVPNAAVQDRIFERVMNFFNTNKKIIQSLADENEWEAYYEQVIEPTSMKLSQEYTRKLFSRRQRGCGNMIYFEAANLQHASIKTKLGLQAMVDRGAMTPNEWREAFNLGPVDGGDKPLLRKDTGVVMKGGEED